MTTFTMSPYVVPVKGYEVLHLLLHHTDGSGMALPPIPMLVEQCCPVAAIVAIEQVQIYLPPPFKEVLN